MTGDDPRIEQRAVDNQKTSRVRAVVATSRRLPTEPWLIHGTAQYIPKLGSFRCPHCKEEIRLDRRVTQ